jgi:hypothetical protein
MNKYQVILQDQNKLTWEGNVITHLPIIQWATNNRYKIIYCSSGSVCSDQEETELHPPIRKRSGMQLAVSFAKKIIKKA